MASIYARSMRQCRRCAFASNNLGAKMVEIKKTLEWYGEQASAMSRYTIAINATAMEAVVTSMALDAGGRAAKALEEVDKKEAEMAELAARIKKMEGDGVVIGSATMQNVFLPNDIVNLYNLQIVFDAVDHALHAKMARIKRLETALLAIGKTIVEDKVAICDTLWMDEAVYKGGTVIDYITSVIDDRRSKDDWSVDTFMEALGSAMKEKLQKKASEDGFKGWDDKDECPKEMLQKQFMEHVKKGDPIDVANYCMFFYHRGERTNG
jgi:hypothetical protein